MSDDKLADEIRTFNSITTGITRRLDKIDLACEGLIRRVDQIEMAGWWVLKGLLGTAGFTALGIIGWLIKRNIE